MPSSEYKPSSDTDSAVDLEINDLVEGLEEVQHRLEREEALPYGQPFPDDEIHQFEQESSFDDTQSFGEEITAGSDKRYKLMMIGAVVFFVLILAALGVFGYRLLSGSADDQKQQRSGSLGFGSETSASAIGAALGVEVESGSEQTLVAFEQEPVDQQSIEPAAEGGGYQGAIELQNDANSDVYAPVFNESEGDVVIAPPAVEPVKASTTAEDEMYDKLLGRVAESGLPLDAIRIDPQVIKSEVEGQRFDAMESAIRQTRSELSEVRTVINEVKSQVSAVSQALEENIARQNALSNDFTGLSRKQDEVSSSVASVKRVADAALSKANKAEKDSRAARELQVARSKPEPSPAKPVEKELAVQNQVIQKPAPAPKPVVIAQQRKPVAVDTSVAVINAALPSQCNGNVVSRVWRLKGVTETTAYVVRAQDNQGLFIKPGVTLPGFGEVLSFDTKSRLVCTTHGLVKR